MKTTTEQTKEPITNVSETVEEAAYKHSSFGIGGGYSTKMKISFIDGANWQKQQSDKEIEKIHNESDRQVCVSFKKGWDSCKQQSDTIIKELVEALELANATLGSCTIMRKELSEFLNMENIEKDKMTVYTIIEKTNEYLNK